MIGLSVLSDMNDVFSAFFFGNGSILGLLLFLALIVGFALMWRYAIVLVQPITVLLAIQYWDNALGWHGLIMILTGIFLTFYSVLHKANRGD